MIHPDIYHQSTAIARLFTLLTPWSLESLNPFYF